MGKLDKHKIRGIIRTSQTYGKNPDRFVEQNELISAQIINFRFNMVC